MDHTVKSETLLRTTTTSIGQKIRFPGPNSEVAASIVEIPPGVSLDWHSHPDLRCGYILDGAVTVEEADGAIHEYSAGTFVVETQGMRHRGENRGAVPVRILVVDVGEAGRENHRHEAPEEEGG